MGEASDDPEKSLCKEAIIKYTYTHAREKEKTQGDQRFQLELVDSSDQAARDERDKVMMDAGWQSPLAGWGRAADGNCEVRRPWLGRQWEQALGTQHN